MQIYSITNHVVDLDLQVKLQWGDWKCKYGKRKYQWMKYPSTENLSANWQGWKMEVSKTQVPNYMGGIRKYGKRKYE